jgi:hypothetical protein
MKDGPVHQNAEERELVVQGRLRLQQMKWIEESLDLGMIDPGDEMGFVGMVSQLGKNKLSQVV